MDTDKRLKEKILAGLEIPPLAEKNCAHIELYANKQACIEGCKGIVEYTDDKIILNIGSVCAKFCGTDLTVSSFDGETAMLSGTFCTIDFC